MEKTSFVGEPKRAFGWPEIIPDPHGLVGFAIVVGVFFSHWIEASGSVSFLLSESAWVRLAAHAWLLGGPPLGLYLGVRHLVVKGDSLLPFFSVPLSFLLTFLTLVGIGLSFLGP